VIYTILIVLILFLVIRDWRIVEISNARFKELEKAKIELETALSKSSLALTSLQSQQQSKSVRLGQITEQVIPFHKDFAYSYKELVPMFRPVDYLHFGEDRITFIEIKMGTSQLSEKQKRIRRQIQEGKVEFVEYRISEEGINVKT
jgi:predicted Holliday junction resolvase-like endonuclease